MKAANDYQQALEGDRRNESAERAAATAAGRKDAGDVKKAGEDVPPGWVVSPGANPGAESRKKFTGLVTTAERMKGLTNQMRAALKGTTGMGRTLDPATKTKLQQLSTQIQIEAKDVAGLGALSGPDMGLMNQMAADPTSIMANLTTDFPTMLGQLDKWADNSVAASSKATGIVRGSGGGAAAPGVKPARKQSKSGRWMVQDADGEWSWEE
jgi:hypothetical protein